MAQSTYCHGCGARLIGRDWYALDGWALDADGRCAVCGARCPGRFESRPGSWGPRRLPVRLAEVAQAPAPRRAGSLGRARRVSEGPAS